MYKFMVSACAIALACGTAHATDYVGSHTFGSTSVDLDITTDGTLGALSKANVTAWSFTLDNGAGPVTFDDTNSQFTYLSGTAFYATATQLLFDFDGYGHMQFDNFASSSSDAFCLTSADAPITCTGPFDDEAVRTGNIIAEISRTGLFVLGTVASPAPEPASWALMLGGFGMVGGAMRSRRKAAVSFA